MVLSDPEFMPMDPDDAAGTVWEQFLALQAEEQRLKRRSYITDIISDGNITLQPGASIDEKVTGNFDVAKLIVDFAADVDGEVWLDGKKRFSTRDGLGLGGVFDLGDGKEVSMSLKEVRVVATNNGSSARDVRAWMVNV